MGLEISQKVKQVFPPFGGEGGVQSNWHYSGGVQNSLMKRLANFEIAKSKTLGVMAQTKNFDTYIGKKKKWHIENRFYRVQNGYCQKFFWKIRIISLNHPKSIGSALRVAGPKKTRASVFREHLWPHLPCFIFLSILNHYHMKPWMILNDLVQ